MKILGAPFRMVTGNKGHEHSDPQIRPTLADDLQGK
jgi:hypothetical protein